MATSPRTRHIAVAFIATAATTSMFIVGGAGAAHATDSGNLCPPGWSTTSQSVPVVGGRGSVEVLLASGDASSPDGTGECASVYFGGAFSPILELGVASPPSGSFVFYNSGLLGTGTQTVPVS
jgi:hypothetical protein